MLSGGAVAAAAVYGAAFADERKPLPLAPTKDGKSTLSPDEALALLKQGNEAFLRDEIAQPEIGAERRLALAKGQAPFCAYVTCSDSRVPPELLFGRGLGELFIIRNAGNTVDTTAMGSIEYAVAVLEVPLVVVMGHESCGAVKAAMAVVHENARFPGSIDDMIQPIIPAVLDTRGQEGDETENAVKQNVRRVVTTLRKESHPMMLAPQRAGKLEVVGAYYNLDTGRGDNQGWSAVFVNGPVEQGNRFLFWFDGHARFRDDATELGTSIIRPGVGWRLDDRVDLWLGYARVTGHRDGPNIDEDRFWQQSTYRIGDVLGGALSGRSRLEQRFRNSGSDTGWRARQFFYYAQRFEGTPFSLVLANEIFFGLNDADWGQRSGYDQNRAFFGAAWHLSPGLRLEAGYLNNNLDGGPGGSNQTNHNFQIAFFVSL
jgi:carbonic anhydrase